MANDQSVRSVLDAARKEAERIVEKARNSAQAKLKAAEEAIAAETERRVQAACRAVDEECARQLGKARGAHGKALLEARNRRLKDVISEARNLVLADAGRYEALMARLLEEAAAGGVPELVEDGVTGVLVPRGDMRALGDAIAFALAHPEMGAAGRARAARFDISEMVTSYAGLFEKL